MSIFERIKAGDWLDIELKPEIKVFCVSCGEHVGYLRSAEGGIENFVPLTDNRQQTTDNRFLCAICGKLFVAFEHINPEPRFKTDRGYIS